MDTRHRVCGAASKDDQREGAERSAAEGLNNRQCHADTALARCIQG